MSASVNVFEYHYRNVVSMSVIDELFAVITRL